MDNMKKQNKLNWYNVNLNQFTKLQEVLQIEDETERLISMAEILLGDEVTNLPLKEFNEQIKQLDFLNDEVPSVTPPKKLEINGRKYYTDCLLGNITTAQYIDFTNHSKTNDVAKILSVFIIPEEHKYNDGYDMIQVINDINCLPIPVVNGIAFFFGRQFNKFIEIFQHYSVKKITKMKLPKTEKKKLVQMVKSSLGLVLSHLS